MNWFDEHKEKKRLKQFKKNVKKYRKKHKKEFEDMIDDIDCEIDRIKYCLNYWYDFDPNFKPHCTQKHLADLLEIDIMRRASIIALLNNEGVDNPSYLEGIDLYIQPDPKETKDTVYYKDLIPPDWIGVDIDDSRYEFGEKYDLL